MAVVNHQTATTILDSQPFTILPSRNSFLWKISAKSLPTDSYLFGTMHVKDIRAFQRLEALKEKIDHCTGFALEFHLDESKIEGAKMMLSPGHSIKDLIPEKKYQKLKRIIFKSTQINLDYFHRASPFMLTSLVSAKILGNEMPESLDEHLWKYASSNNKSLHGIETFAEQMAIMGKIPLEVQLKMLLDLGRNIKKQRKYIHHTATLYQQGEMLRLSKIVKKNAGGLRKILLYHRNKIMADRIFEMIQKESLFAAVGAGHLGGGKGVIRLLKKHGLNLKPISY